MVAVTSGQGEAQRGRVTCSRAHNLRKMNKLTPAKSVSRAQPFNCVQQSFSVGLCKPQGLSFHVSNFGEWWVLVLPLTPPFNAIIYSEDLL